MQRHHIINRIATLKGGILMTRTNKCIMTLSKGLEIFHWIGVAVFAVSFLAVIQAVTTSKSAEFSAILSKSELLRGTLLPTYTLSFSVLNPNGSISLNATAAFLLTSIFNFVITALIFRYIGQIFRVMRKGTSAFGGSAPFHPAVSSKIRRIAVCFFLFSLTGFLISIAVILLLGKNYTDLYIGLGNIFSGIIALSLSQVFSYGTQLQADTEGLV